MRLDFLEKSFGYELSQNLLAYFLSKKSTKELAKRLKKYRAKKILDIGCATAFYRKELKVADYTGTDINRHFITSANKRFPEDKFFVMDASLLKFPDNTFDAVISKGVLHHLSDEKLIKSLQESLRVCERNGVVITLDAIQPTKNWNVIGKLLRNLDQGNHVKHASEYKKLLAKYYVLDEFKVVFSFPYEVCIYTINKSKNLNSCVDDRRLKLKLF